MNADKVSAYKVAKDVLPLGTSYEVVWGLALWFLDVELDSDLTASAPALPRATRVAAKLSTSSPLGFDDWLVEWQDGDEVWQRNEICQVTRLTRVNGAWPCASCEVRHTDRQVSLDFAQGEAFLIKRRGNSLPLDEAELS